MPCKTIRKTRRFEKQIPALQISKEDGLVALSQILGVKTQISVVEQADASHVSGTFVVASMVRFVDGKAGQARV